MSKNTGHDCGVEQVERQGVVIIGEPVGYHGANLVREAYNIHCSGKRIK